MDPEQLEQQQEDDSASKFKPNKEEREVRRRVYDRWQDMRNDPQRKAAEQDWDDGDKNYRMYVPEIDPDDWRSHLELPDAFSAIQVHMQETIDRKSRPAVQDMDEVNSPKEKFCNAIMNWNMTRTGFDLEYFYAKLAAAIRGTAFLKNYYRLEKRKIKDIVGVNEDGTLKYQEKEIIDFDDDYTEWIGNEWVYFDPSAKRIEEAADSIEREILPIEKFRSKYGNKPEFKNTEFVKPGGDVGRTRFFKTPEDLTADEVEVLHLNNRDTDRYEVVANNIPIRYGPMPTKHKELPYAVVYHYRVPGRFWGLGVPKIIQYLSEERKAIRRLNLDRQKMHLNKMFLHNNAFDIDEEDLETRPHGLVSVDTQGQPLANVIQPLEYGDVPASYFRTEEILLEDIRRAHGYDDRIVVSDSSTTATQAAIVKESALKRVNLISVLAEMDTIVRIGRLKWANIQFYYKAPRIEKIMGKGGEETKKRVSRKVRIEGMVFTLKKAEGQDNDKFELDAEELDGHSTFEINRDSVRFMEGEFEVQMGASVEPPISKAIKQAKVTEMLTSILSNQVLTNELDPKKAMKRYIQINDEDPNEWMRDPKTKEKQEELAELENQVMANGHVLQGTEGATIDHTKVHLDFTETKQFDELPETTQQIIINHIMEEHDANPMTGSSADLMKQFGVSPDPLNPAVPSLAGLGVGPPTTVEGAPAPSLNPAVAGSPQVADITPANNNPAPE